MAVSTTDAPRVLLVNPWIHDFAAYDFWAKPLGLLTLAALLRSRGCRVTYMDCLNRFHRLALPQDPFARMGRGPFRKTPIPRPPGLDDVTRRFSRYGIDPEWFTADLARVGRPDLILVTSGMTYWASGVAETIQRVRSALPDVPVVLGGTYATLCPDHAGSRSGADRVVAGPGENAVFQLLAEFTGCSISPPFDPGDPDARPFPAFDLQDRIGYIPIRTVRGCPFDCAYCASRYLDPAYRPRSPASVIEEIRFWHGAHGVKDFVFYDDALLADPHDHALPLLEGIVRSGLCVRFHTPNALHVRGITDTVARLMRAAGFHTVRLGLETVDPELHASLDRKVTLAEFRRSVACLHRAGFPPSEIGAYLMVGLPGQSMTSVNEAAGAVKRAGATPIPAYYTPIPHTRLWEAAMAASRYDLASDPVFTNNAVMPCSKTPFSWNILARIQAMMGTSIG